MSPLPAMMTTTPIAPNARAVPSPISVIADETARPIPRPIHAAERCGLRAIALLARSASFAASTDTVTQRTRREHPVDPLLAQILARTIGGLSDEVEEIFDLGVVLARSERAARQGYGFGLQQPDGWFAQ